MPRSILPFVLVCAVVSIGSSAYCQDLKQKYVGGSGCRAEFQRGPGTYGIRLDYTQKAYLKAYVVEDRHLLLIIQYSDDKDQCGVIRDVVQTDSNRDFVWDCMDPKAPHDVIVGTWRSHYIGTTGPALEAWRINPRKLEFLSIPARARCTSGPGPDDPSHDLVDYAKKRTANFQ